MWKNLSPNVQCISAAWQQLHQGMASLTNDLESFIDQEIKRGGGSTSSPLQPLLGSLHKAKAAFSTARTSCFDDMDAVASCCNTDGTDNGNGIDIGTLASILSFYSVLFQQTGQLHQEDQLLLNNCSTALKNAKPGLMQSCCGADVNTSPPPPTNRGGPSTTPNTSMAKAGGAMMGGTAAIGGAAVLMSQQQQHHGDDDDGNNSEGNIDAAAAAAAVKKSKKDKKDKKDKKSKKRKQDGDDQDQENGDQNEVKKKEPEVNDEVDDSQNTRGGYHARHQDPSPVFGGSPKQASDGPSLASSDPGQAAAFITVNSDSALEECVNSDLLAHRENGNFSNFQDFDILLRPKMEYSLDVDMSSASPGLDHDQLGALVLGRVFQSCFLDEAAKQQQSASSSSSKKKSKHLIKKTNSSFFALGQTVNLHHSSIDKKEAATSGTIPPVAWGESEQEDSSSESKKFFYYCFAEFEDVGPTLIVHTVERGSSSAVVTSGGGGRKSSAKKKKKRDHHQNSDDSSDGDDNDGNTDDSSNGGGGGTDDDRDSNGYVVEYLHYFQLSRTSSSSSSLLGSGSHEGSRKSLRSNMRATMGIANSPTSSSPSSALSSGSKQGGGGASDHIEVLVKSSHLVRFSSRQAGKDKALNSKVNAMGMEFLKSCKTLLLQRVSGIVPKELVAKPEQDSHDDADEKQVPQPNGTADSHEASQEPEKKKNRALDVVSKVIFAPFSAGKFVVDKAAGAVRGQQEQMFKNNFPDHKDEEILDIFNCALVDGKLLRQGYLFVGPKHAFFCGTILNGQFALAYDEIKSIKKKKTMVVLPNAIEIESLNNEKYFLTSFVKRDDAFNLLYNTWSGDS